MVNEFLRRVSDEPLMLDPIRGSKKLVRGNDVFAWGAIDEMDCFAGKLAFNKWMSKPREAIGTQVYELTRNATFVQMFASLAPDLDVRRLCLAQDQIINFVNLYGCWLRGANFFLVETSLWESRKYILVLILRRLPRKKESLSWRAEFFGNEHIWSANDRPRLVVPQRAR
jgi:hypothetical protein